MQCKEPYEKNEAQSERNECDMLRARRRKWINMWDRARETIDERTNKMSEGGYSTPQQTNVGRRNDKNDGENNGLPQPVSNSPKKFEKKFNE